MVPSGSWRGYYEQHHRRQVMDDLTLHFAKGRISGIGRDFIGPFTFDGTYDDQGTVMLVKRYLGRHTVEYLGQYDGEGTIFGRWSIDGFGSGPFALSPANYEVPADAPILTIAPQSP